MRVLKTYICANSRNGFFSLQDEVINTNLRNAYIIKGGPGTGKSSFMKKIANGVSAEQTELIYCSSDPCSLDGLLIDNSTLFFDGTAPHLAEPPVPGACGSVVNIGDFWNADTIKNSFDDINTVSSAISEGYTDVYRLLHAAGEISDIIYHYGKENILYDKLGSYTDNLSKRLFKTKNRKGNKIKRFLGALNCRGYTEFTDTLKVLAQNITVLSDRYGAVSDRFLKKLSAQAVKKGYTVWEFCSPLDPSVLEHIAIPELSLAYTVSTYLPDNRKINCRRFMLDDTDRNPRIKFYEKLKKELINGAQQLFTEIKARHDELEQFYIPAMDFSAIDRLSDKFIKKLS